jgi:hypothetical protein
MHRLKMFMATLIAAVAIVAVAAPASPARPLDLNTPMPKEQAPAQSGAEAYPKGPVYWSYDYPAPQPKLSSAPAQDDSPWVLVGLAVTGGCLVLGGAVAVSRTRLRARRERVAA